MTYDPDATDPETFIAELEDKTGFQGRVVEPTDSVDQEQAPGDGSDGSAR